MNLLVCLAENPTENMPIWAALTDAAQAVTPLHVVLVGSASAVDWMRQHPAVSEGLTLPPAFSGRAFSPWVAWAARRLRAQIRQWSSPPELLIDPFGQLCQRRVVRALPVRSVGVSRAPAADRDYDSTYPIPPGLHPVQAIRVLFAAAIGYSLHDVAPDFGLPLAASIDAHHADGLVVDLLVDWQGVPWSDDERASLRAYLSASGLRVAYLPDPLNRTDAAARWLEDVPLLDSARYVLTGNSPLAWFAAATGKPGLCVCAEGTAKTAGVISTRAAKQKMLNIEDPSLIRPQVVAASIVQVLSRQGTALV